MFWLGSHMPAWLAASPAPLFISAVRLRRRKSPPRAVRPWAMDSGGFSELALHGRWTIPASQYGEEAQRWGERIGGLSWAAPQDWMCEPIMTAKTGLGVEEHQRRTVASVLELRRLAPSVPWIPVLQGWRFADYWRHVRQYEAAGFDLASEPLVGLGSVCRRQATGEAASLVRDLASAGIRLHGFGFKTDGLRRCGRHLASADSMAWSAAARKQPVRLPGHPHRTCANCMDWALIWRERVLAAWGEGRKADSEDPQGLLWEACEAS